MKESSEYVYEFDQLELLSKLGLKGKEIIYIQHLEDRGIIIRTR